MPHLGLLEPRYDAGGLAGVLPGVAASLGVEALAHTETVPMRPARRAGPSPRAGADAYRAEPRLRATAGSTEARLPDA